MGVEAIHQLRRKLAKGNASPEDVQLGGFWKRVPVGPVGDHDLRLHCRFFAEGVRHTFKKRLFVPQFASRLFRQPSGTKLREICCGDAWPQRFLRKNLFATLSKRTCFAFCPSGLLALAGPRLCQATLPPDFAKTLPPAPAFLHS